jgi:hypothetical protein
MKKTCWRSFSSGEIQRREITMIAYEVKPYQINTKRQIFPSPPFASLNPQLLPDHWEYQIIRRDDSDPDTVTYWDSIECDNGMPSQWAQTEKEAREAGEKMLLEDSEEELAELCRKPYFDGKDFE